MTLVDEQREAMAFLADPSHWDGVSAVERLDTHTAAVFLAGERAYKLKRAVRYDYLDYSTLDQRARACRAEVELNRRTAPTVYLDAVPITRSADGGLALGCSGSIVDWVVVMRRFPQEALLDRLAEDKTLSLADASRLGDVVADFHAAAAVRTTYGGASAIHRVIDGNEAAFAAAAGVIDASLAATVTAALRDLANRHARLLDDRRTRGFVRQCHGDLHLRNIVMIEGAPTLFDAVEFNDEFACIDVLYDAAFLLMDLIARDLPVHANVTFNRYLIRTLDIDGLALLPLFVGCRAAIRAKTSLAAAALAADAVRASALHERAAYYLGLASRLVAPAPPRLIAIGGYSGAGKSTLAQRLAPTVGIMPGAIVLRTDEMRRRTFATLDQAVPRWAYAAEMREKVYAEIRDLAERALSTGYSVIVDGVFNDFIERRAIEGEAAVAGVPFRGLWLDADRPVLEQRILTRRSDVSDATLAVLARQMRRPLRHLRWAIVNAGGTPDDTLKAAQAALGDSKQTHRHVFAELARTVL